MTKAQTKAAIDAAYRALERACGSSDEGSRLLHKAFNAALESERAHRRFGAGFGGYRVSAETAARYFTVKWVVDPGKVTNAREAAALRLDCLYSSALREVLIADGYGRNLFEALSEAAILDYSRDIARAS